MKIKIILVMLVIVIALMGFMAIAPLHASSNTVSPEVSNTNITTGNWYQTAQIIGYDKAYGLYVTAIAGQNTTMISTFFLNVTSPGNSTVAVYEGTSMIYSQPFVNQTDTRTITIVSTNGTVPIQVILSSSNGHSRTLTYFLRFMTPVQYINYLHTKTVVPTKNVFSLSEVDGTLIIGGYFGILSVGAAISRQRASPKGWQLKKDVTKKEQKDTENKKTLGGYFGIGTKGR